MRRSIILRAALFAGFAIVTAHLHAQRSAVPLAAPTPPMGWNSWDAYGLTVTEDQFRANVNLLATKLKPYGWNYAVIDEGWFFFNPQDRPHPDLLHYSIDPWGRYVPVPERFPSSTSLPGNQIAPTAPAFATPPRLAATVAETSFKPLADWVHAQGLKFGIHIVRGIPRASVERNLPIAGSSFHAADAADTSDACPWDPTNWGVKDNAAGQAWYDSLLEQYATWGVDLLKVDCISDHPYKADEIRMIRRAIDKATARTGRPIVLSLSPGPTALEHADEVAAEAQMWRISDDVWDLWSNPKPWPIAVSSQFARLAAWAPHVKPGHWPDADMLPLGELRPSPGTGAPRSTRLTPAEQRTQLTLWSIARSPLILGANLTLLDDATLHLLTAPNVLRIDQTAIRSRQVFQSGGVIAWIADLPASQPPGLPPALQPPLHSSVAEASRALALFNTGDQQVTITAGFAAYGLDAASYRVTDAWTGKFLGRMNSVAGVTIEPHASVLWLLN
ncbi:MAG TPA: glycoside hydrolase family 27 protein [Acidobacteriaceae bacterium]|nr:glycoside hydrolase family 27 protein [Acidobacteriaceae bacterium]